MSDTFHDIGGDVRKIFEFMRASNYPTGFHIRGGINQCLLKQLLHNYDLFAPPDLIELYEVSDGTHNPVGLPLGRVCFFPGYHWLCLNDAILQYNYNINSSGWRPGWLPVFANGGGDFYAVCCQLGTPEEGKVCRIMRGEDDLIIEYRSIADFVRIHRVCYEYGFYQFSDGFLCCDFKGRRDVASAVQGGFLPYALA